MGCLAINEIYNMDCMNFLKQVKNSSVDLAVIDPPYNMGKADWDTFASHDDFMKFTKNFQNGLWI